MTDFTNSMDIWLSLYQQGIKWNPEELLGAAMLGKGYSWPPTNFDSSIRGHQYGYWHKGTNGDKWIPDFGRWN